MIISILFFLVTMIFLEEAPHVLKLSFLLWGDVSNCTFHHDQLTSKILSLLSMQKRRDELQRLKRGPQIWQSKVQVKFGHLHCSESDDVLGISFVSQFLQTALIMGFFFTVLYPKCSNTALSGDFWSGRRIVISNPLYAS